MEGDSPAWRAWLRLPGVLSWAWLLAAWLVAAGAASAQTAGVLRLTQADFVAGEGPLPPAQGWVPGTVPEIFARQPLPAERIGWYRFSFDLAEPPSQPLVLLAQRVVTTAEFRLNGSLLNPDVRFGLAGEAAPTHMLNWPHWIVLPPGLFHAGRNELLVRLRGDAFTPAWISGLSIGPAQALRGEFLLRDIPQRQIPQALCVLLLASLLFGLRLWWRERHPLHAHLVLTAALWVLPLVMLPFTDLPLQRATQVAGVVVIWVAFHWALLLLLWRLSRSPWTWFPRVVAIGSALPLALALAALVLGPSQSLLGALMLPSLLLRLLTLAMLVHWSWRERSWSAALLTAAELLWLAGPVQTMLVALDLLPPDPFMLSPANALPMYLVMLGLAAQRLVEQREAQVRQREAAVLAERQRILLDMHDGVGSQLVTAVRLARREDVPREEVARIVQEALHDLRLIIDSLDGGAQELQPLLGQLRQRIEGRLKALGQSLAWQIDDLPAPRRLSPGDALDVLRIVQEALNNAVRHAGASTIGISLGAVPGGCELRIADDGTGIAAEAAGNGRGLAGMRQRAVRLGGRLELRRNGERGTVVSLRLPDVGVRA